MEIKKLLKRVLTRTCVYFTIITAFYMLILQIANIQEGAAAVEAPRVLLFFLASLLFSVANAIYSIKQINSALRVIIHYLICVLAFYCCFLLPVNMQASFAITGVVVFTVLYAVIMIAIAIFSARLKANREKDSEYESQFSKGK